MILKNEIVSPLLLFNWIHRQSKVLCQTNKRGSQFYTNDTVNIIYVWLRKKILRKYLKIKLLKHVEALSKSGRSFTSSLLLYFIHSFVRPFFRWTKTHSSIHPSVRLFGRSFVRSPKTIHSFIHSFIPKLLLFWEEYTCIITFSLREIGRTRDQMTTCL